MSYVASVQNLQEVAFLWLIPLFPLLGATINGLLGKKIQDRFGKGAVHSIAIGAMALAAAVACYAFFARLLPLPAGSRVLHDTVFPMIHIRELHVDFALAMDQLSGTMTLIITIIGTGIHVYSSGYMHDEPAYWRFFSYLNLFVFSMLLLVLGDSFVLMFFGWEGVGLCSYLLIGFWYTDFAKATAGMKAFVVNRIGDFAFITGLFLLFWGLGGAWNDGQYVDIPDRTVEARRIDPGAHEVSERAPVDTETVKITFAPTVQFHELRAQMAVTEVRPDGRVSTFRPFAESLAAKKVWGIPILFLVCLCFFIGACGKSAQIPLYVWLPDAMAGPTPVSALIHAATMVTAGVYMVARLNFLFWWSPGAMTVVAMVGVLTALFAATMGLFQYDIKKVLAYSTVSQLGFMFIGVGVGAWWAGIFHLLTHACFKACLFLGSGSVIHGMHFLHHGHGHSGHDEDHKPRDLRLEPDPHDPQDMRNMGGLATLMPWTRWTYLIACISIAGFPIAAGFYSKDEILWKAMANGNTLIPGPVIWVTGWIAAGCTAFYMFRSYYMTFHRRAPTPEMREHVHESPKSMTYVLWGLAGLAVITGPVLGFPMLWSGQEPIFEQWLHPVMSLAPFESFGRPAMHSHLLEALGMVASVVIATAGWYVARALYRDESLTAERIEAMKTRYALWHRVLFHKYYVDEIYQATFVRGFMALARACAYVDKHGVDWVVNATAPVTKACAGLSGWIDRIFVDGAVNGLAAAVVRFGKEGRRVQTGRVNNYVYGVVVGVLALFIITSMVS